MQGAGADAAETFRLLHYVRSLCRSGRDWTTHNSRPRSSGNPIVLKYPGVDTRQPAQGGRRSPAFDEAASMPIPDINPLDRPVADGDIVKSGRKREINETSTYSGLRLNSELE
jgi:hypothetical protein